MRGKWSEDHGMYFHEYILRARLNEILAPVIYLPISLLGFVRFGYVVGVGPVTTLSVVSSPASVFAPTSSTPITLTRSAIRCRHQQQHSLADPTDDGFIDSAPTTVTNRIQNQQGKLPDPPFVCCL